MRLSMMIKVAFAGLICLLVRPSVGTPLSERFSKRFARSLADEDPIVDLQVDKTDDFAPPHLLQAMLQALASNDTSLNQYASGRGHPRLRKALAAFYSRVINREIDWQKNVLVTIGATEAIFDSFHALTQPGDEWIVVEPFFSKYAPTIKIAGGIPKFTSMKLTKTSGEIKGSDWVLNKEELRSLFNNKTRGIIINNPNNPTGKILTMEDLQFIADLVKQHDAYVIADDAHEWVLFDPVKTPFIRMVELPGMWERTITIGSASKSFTVSGWRVGWAYAPANLISRLLEIHANAVQSVNNNKPMKDLRRMRSNDRKVICYYGSWSVYRPGLGKFDISHIDASLCTHLIYAFAGLGESGEVKILDPWNDLPDGGGKDGYRKFNALRKDNPELKTMIGMGGWNEGSSKYSSLATNETMREKFADNVVEFLKKYGFNGFDLDWEYPCQRGGSPCDKENFVQLLKTLRKRFDRESEQLVLSAAVASAEMSASKSYDIRAVCESLDFVNVMCYDLHGSWDKKTGVNAPLYPGTWETDYEKKLNVDSCIQYWLSQGAPAEKLVLGVPFYGRGFTLANASQSSGIGAPAYSGSEPGPYTREAGMLGYNEILEDIAKGWQVHFQEEQKVPYAVHGNLWVGYDDERSLKDKTDYIKKHGLGGAMAWSIETDDFLGTAGKKYPLLNVLHRELRGDGATYYTDYN